MKSATNTAVSTMSATISNNGLNDAFDKIVTYLTDGAIWHKRIANQERKIGIRGPGRWNDEEGKGDYCSSSKLEKLLGDNLDYYPNIDTKSFETSVRVVLNNIDDFKASFETWIRREDDLISVLNYAINETRVLDIQIYDCLCCLLKEVQNEKTIIKKLHKRLELAKWGEHDVGIVSMIIHEFFECEYKQGDMIDFNIG